MAPARRRQLTTTMLLLISGPVREPDAALITYVRTKLARLETLLTIKSAQITLLKNSRPPGFRATVQLEGPGPYLRGDGADHTETSALDRAFANLNNVPAWHAASL